MRGGAVRPNNRKLEGRILLTIRPNCKAEFDHKAKNDNATTMTARTGCSVGDLMSWSGVSSC